MRLSSGKNIHTKEIPKRSGLSKRGLGVANQLKSNVNAFRKRGIARVKDALVATYSFRFQMVEDWE